MASAGATVIPYGCPDCDGDLIFIADKGNNISELQCKICNSIYLVTIVGGKYESDER